MARVLPRSAQSGLPAEHQAALAKLGRLALTGIDLHELLHEAASLVAATLKVEFCKILEVLPDGRSLLLRAGVGWREGLVGQAVVPASSETHAGHALLSRAPVIVEDLHADARFLGPSLLHDHGITSGVSLVIPGAEPFGVLGVHTLRRRSFTQHELAFLEAAAEVLATAIERHRHAEAVRRSEEQFRRTFDDSPIGMTIIGLDHRFLRANRVLRELLGYSEEELTGLTLEQITHPDDVQGTVALLQKLFRGEIPHFELAKRDLTKIGETVWVKLTATLVRDDLGGPLHAVGMIEDLTRRRQSDRDLRLARFTLDRAREAIAWAAPDGRIVDANAAMCTLLGYSREELLSRKVSDIDETVREQSWPAAWEMLKRQGSLSCESRFRAKDGRAIAVELTVNYLYFNGEEFQCAIAREIGERKRMEEALRASEQRLRESEEHHRALIENALDLITILRADGTVRYVSPSIERVLGYKAQERIGRSTFEIIHPDELAAVKDALSRGIERPGATATLEFRVRHKDGSWRTLEAVARNLLDNPAVAGVVINSRDITERKAAERSLLKSQAALERSQEELRALAAKLLGNEEEEHRRLARELHDDFGQRLTAACFDLAGLDERCPPEAPAGLRRRLRRARARLAELSDDVRRLARQLHPAALELLGLPAALRQLCEEAQGPGRWQVRFRTRTLPESFPQDIAVCLYRVAQECFRNIARHAQADQVRVTLVGVPAGVRLTIQDNGIGFDPLSAGATGGLGLVSMKERVRFAGGTLSVNSRAGKGTRVTAEIPLKRSP